MKKNKLNNLIMYLYIYLYTFIFSMKKYILQSYPEALENDTTLYPQV